MTSEYINTEDNFVNRKSWKQENWLRLGDSPAGAKGNWHLPWCSLNIANNNNNVHISISPLMLLWSSKFHRHWGCWRPRNQHHHWHIIPKYSRGKKQTWNRSAVTSTNTDPDFKSNPLPVITLTSNLYASEVRCGGKSVRLPHKTTGHKQEHS